MKDLESDIFYNIQNNKIIIDFEKKNWILLLIFIKKWIFNVETKTKNY